MSPARFHHQHNNNILNGPRPSSLKINKEFHLLHKHSSSSSSLSSSISVIGGGGGGINKNMEQKNPVIIYTQSPKVIHTQARDFMALVQKLTGLSSSKNQENAVPTQQEQKESYSVSTGGEVSPILNPPKNPYYFADIPLFTPTAVELDFFCSARPPIYTSPPAGISPPVFEFMKGVPES